MSMEENLKDQQPLIQPQDNNIFQEKLHREKRNWLKLSLLVISVISLCGIAYYLYLSLFSHFAYRSTNSKQAISPAPTIPTNKNESTSSDSNAPWRTFIDNDSNVFFMYPQNAQIVHIGNGLFGISRYYGDYTYALNILFSWRNIGIGNPYKSEIITSKNGDIITLSYYRSPNSSLDPDIVSDIVGKYNENKILYTFAITIKDQDIAAAMPDLKKIISSFALIPKNQSLDEDGLKTFSAILLIERRQFSFKYPSNYVVSYPELTLTDQNNKKNVITLDADNQTGTTAPQSYEDAVNTFKNYSGVTTNEFENGVIISGLTGPCYGNCKNQPTYSVIIIPYGKFAATITYTPTVPTKDLMIVANSFRYID